MLQMKTNEKQLYMPARKTVINLFMLVEYFSLPLGFYSNENEQTDYNKYNLHIMKQTNHLHKSI